MLDLGPGHAALHAFATIDEPYDTLTYDNLNLLYTQLRPPSGQSPAYLRRTGGVQVTYVPQWVNFSGQLELYQGDNSRRYGTGLCDIAAITRLAFRDVGEDDPYLRRNLKDVHNYSRRVIRQQTPTVPIWTQIPAFAVGSYRFPSSWELKDYLNLVLKELGGNARLGEMGEGGYGDMALERIAWQRWAHRDDMEGGRVMRDAEGGLSRYWAARLALPGA